MAWVQDNVYTALDQTFSLDCKTVRLLLLTDGYPPDPQQHFIWANARSLAWQNTREILAAARLEVDSFQQLLDRGILLFPSLAGEVPAKVPAAQIAAAAERLEALLALLPNLAAIGLMGDVAIATFNQMHRRVAGARLIPAESTYKIRRQDFFWRGVQVFPSYLHTGKSFLIEGSKRDMVADDMRRMAHYLQSV